MKSKEKTAFLPDQPKEAKHPLTEQEHQRLHELILSLQKVSQVLTLEVDLHKILEDVATTVGKALGAKWVNFWELTPDKKAAHISVAYGMEQSYIEQSRKHPIELGKAWIGRAIATGRAWSTTDILKDPHLMQDLGPTWKTAIKKQDYRALVCVPTISRKGPVGGICVYFPDPHEFTDFEMRLVTVAANQAATAITNSQIFGELIAERNKTLAMLNSLHDGLIMYDLQDKIIAFNPRVEELLWISGDNFIGKKPSELSPQAVGAKNILAISSIAIEEFQTKEILILTPQRLFLKVTHVPVRSPQQSKLGSMRILHDITAEKETEELKSGFVSIASHQLRTPLSGIKWALDELIKGEFGKISASQLELLTKLYHTNEELIKLVNDLLDVARIEEGRFGYTFHPIDIFNLTKKILSSFESHIRRKNLALTIAEPPVSLPLISADIKKLEMAMRNVIENAIKYTLPQGKIAISFHKETSSVIMQVKDTGIGVPRHQQKFLFTKFFRADNAIHLQTEGSGLGLWIANEITKRHNGKIYAESEESKGSTFSLQFPTDPSLVPKGKIEGL